MTIPVRFAAQSHLQLAVTLLILLMGCGESLPYDTGAMDGVIKSNGTPLTLGTVVFYSPETGFGASDVLKSDGSFHLDLLRVGDYQVSILPPVPEPRPGGEPAPRLPDAKTMAKLIPVRYREDSTTPLKATVKAGANNVEFELIP